MLIRLRDCSGTHDHCLLYESRELIAMMRSKPKLVLKPLPDGPTQRKPDMALAEERLGRKPQVPLEAGLVKTIDYLKQLVDR